jgi:histone H1/5
MMLFAGLLAARKKVSFWRLGSAKFWLKSHLWLGTLSFPMIMFHAGFELGGTLEKVLWGFFAVVMLTGFFGLVVQNILPRLLNSRVPLETMRAQIPYVRKRNRVISDRLVSLSCGAIPLDNDPIVAELKGLTQHGVEVNELEAEAKALNKTAKTKEEKDTAKAVRDKAKLTKPQWVDRILKGEEGLYLDLAAFSKTEWGGQTADDFTSMLPAIYTIKGVNDQPPKAPPVAEALAAPKKKAAKKAGGSPFDQVKPKPAAGGAKPSPFDQAKAAGAKKPAKAKAGGSPLDMARQAGAAGKKSDAAPAASKLSPLEQARLAGPKGGKSKAAMSAAAPAGSAPVKQVGPAPKKGKGIKKPDPTPAEVSDIDVELAAIQKLLTEKYNYDSGDAQTYAESTRSFLKTDPAALKLKAESEVKSICSLLADKYGYTAELATEIAEIARPFLDGSAEEQAAAKKAAVEAAKAKPKAAAPAAASTEAPTEDKPLSPLEAARKAGPAGGAGAAPAAEKPLSPLEAARQAGAAGGAKKKPVSPLEAARQAGAAGGAKKKLASPLEAARQAGAAGGAKKKPVSPLEAARQAGAAGGAKKPASPLDAARQAGAAGGAKKKASPLDAARQAGAAGAAKKKPASPLEAARQAGGAGGAKKKAASPFDQKPKAAAAPKKKAAPKKAAVKKPPVPKKKAVKKKSPVLRTDELRAFYLNQVRPYLQSNGKQGRLADKTESNRAFTAMRATLPVELHDTLSSLRGRCDENRQFALQQRIHNWLHYWLALHIPFSIALFVLAAVHIVVALRVIPWEFPKLW